MRKMEQFLINKLGARPLNKVDLFGLLTAIVFFTMLILASS